MERNPKLLQLKFKEIFGNFNRLVFTRAPGRVNLIGEHTDYNEGFVFPVALDLEIVMASRPREDRMVSLYSLDYSQEVSFYLDNIKYESQVRWSNYPRGVAYFLEKAGHHLRGMEAVLQGNIPVGAGLSSSAALEMVTAITFQIHSRFEISPLEMIKLCQKAENEFVGVNCGIMDQFISRLGRKNHALLIDCRQLEHRPVPVSSEVVKIVICDTGVKRGLVDSEYNTRRRECEEGVKIFQNYLPGVKALRDVTINDFYRYEDRLPSRVARRCRHVISENERVLTSVDALEKGDLETFGELLNQSHRSLRDDYEVSCRELDLMVDIAQQVEGVLGSRMTGAGFGGCTVNLVRPKILNDFERAIRENYFSQTGIHPRVWVCSVEEGAGEIKVE